MRKIFISSIFILTFSAAMFAQTNENPPCPTISVTGPAGVTIIGQTMTFTANVSTDNQIKYDWSVSSGTIIEGQGTPVIKILSNLDSEPKEVTATVKIDGLAKNCINTASEQAIFDVACRLPITLDEYGKLSLQDEKARLDNVAAQLLKDKTTSAVFIMYYSGENVAQNLEKRKSRILNYFNQTHKISKERVVIFFGGEGENRTRIYLAPAGAILADYK